jgi:hypothetical protein
MYTDYPPFDTLNTAPSYLLIGASAIHNLRARSATPPATYASPDPLPEVAQPPTRKHVKGNALRTYRSVYVGVTTHNKYYVSREAGGKTHSLDAAGERAAAESRAQALGRDYLERRDGTRETI